MNNQNLKKVSNPIETFRTCYRGYILSKSKYFQSTKKPNSLYKSPIGNSIPQKTMDASMNCVVYL